MNAKLGENNLTQRNIFARIHDGDKENFSRSL